MTQAQLDFRGLPDNQVHLDPKETEEDKVLMDLLDPLGLGVFPVYQVHQDQMEGREQWGHQDRRVDQGQLGQRVRQDIPAPRVTRERMGCLVALENRALQDPQDTLDHRAPGVWQETEELQDSTDVTG